ncbi:MAG: hypothetical protein KGZ52_10855 [Xanthomonadaceae bacterium]|jgi:heme exporter protein D|nr:hypothetical protein [Xanthomonadaceae bacterium]
MEHLHPWFLAGAFGISAVLLVADAVLPRIKFKSLLRGILLRERRQSKPERPAP